MSDRMFMLMGFGGLAILLLLLAGIVFDIKSYVELHELDILELKNKDWKKNT